MRQLIGYMLIIASLSIFAHAETENNGSDKNIDLPVLKPKADKPFIDLEKTKPSSSNISSSMRAHPSWYFQDYINEKKTLEEKDYIYRRNDFDKRNKR